MLDVRLLLAIIVISEVIINFALIVYMLFSKYYINKTEVKLLPVREKIK